MRCGASQQFVARPDELRLYERRKDGGEGRGYARPWHGGVDHFGTGFRKRRSAALRIQATAMKAVSKV